MKKKITDILLVLIFVIGLSLLLYPTVANWYNSRHSSFVILDYNTTVSHVDNKKYEEIWQKAREFNASHASVGVSVSKERDWNSYLEQLSVDDRELMGYVEIPSINISLPIYHGTDEESLAVGVGHIEWTSLPTGNIGTHAALSSHRGLPSARLFTDLDRVVVGDVFILNILNEVFTYEVDQILIVLPEDMEALAIDPDKDLCTLITCTPYGINSHRLLVRGHRVANQMGSAAVRVPADAFQIEPVTVAPIVAVPILLVLVFWVLITTRKGGKHEN